MMLVVTKNIFFKKCIAFLNTNYQIENAVDRGSHVQ